jgi:hypothetical protein
VRYLERRLDRLDAPLDSYTLGLVANALLASGADATATLDQLLARAQQEGEAVYWTPGDETYFGSYGLAGNVEVTAIAAQALLRSGSSPAEAQGALAYLAANRDPNGSFYTTQATVQALKALLLGVEETGSDRSKTEPEPKTETVTVTYTAADGVAQTQTIVLVPDSDVVQTVAFADVVPGARLTLTADGSRPLPYQVVTEYYQPWDAPALSTAAGAGAGPNDAANDAPASDTGTTDTQPPLRLAVSYDRNELLVGEMLGVSAAVQLQGGATAATLIVELGLPPGFAPMTGDLDTLVAEEQIERYELTGRSIVLYLTDVAGGVVYHFDYRLQARLPLAAQSIGSQAYDYYAPEQRVSVGPARVTVALGTP